MSIKLNRLVDLLFFTNTQKVLGYFLEHPETEHYDRQVSSLVEISRAGANVALRELAEVGLLHRRERGRMCFYSLRQDHPLISILSKLRTLVAIESLIEKLWLKKGVRLQEKDMLAIAEAIMHLKAAFPIREIRLFGSKARGDDDKESDIDLLVLTSKELSRRERRKMTDAMFEIQLKNDATISLLILSQEEWKQGMMTVLPIHASIEREGVAA